MKNSQKQLLEVLNPKRLLENVAKFKVKYLCRNLFLIKLQPVGPELYLNETLTHVFCEFSKMFQNTILIGHLQTTTSFLDTTASELSEHEIISEITEAATGMFHKKAILKNFLVFIGKHLCWSIFFKIKLQDVRLMHLFSWTHILKNINDRLLLRLTGIRFRVRWLEFIDFISSKFVNKKILENMIIIHHAVWHYMDHLLRFDNIGVWLHMKLGFLMIGLPILSITWGDLLKAP